MWMYTNAKQLCNVHVDSLKGPWNQAQTSHDHWIHASVNVWVYFMMVVLLELCREDAQPLLPFLQTAQPLLPFLQTNCVKTDLEYYNVIGLVYLENGEYKDSIWTNLCESKYVLVCIFNNMYVQIFRGIINTYAVYYIYYSVLYPQCTSSQLPRWSAEAICPGKVS